MLKDLISSLQRAETEGMSNYSALKFIDKFVDVCLPGAQVFVLENQNPLFATAINAIIQTSKVQSADIQKDTPPQEQQAREEELNKGNDKNLVVAYPVDEIPHSDQAPEIPKPIKLSDEKQMYIHNKIEKTMRLSKAWKK